MTKLNDIRNTPETEITINAINKITAKVTVKKTPELITATRITTKTLGTKDNTTNLCISGHQRQLTTKRQLQAEEIKGQSCASTLTKWDTTLINVQIQ